MPELTVSNVTCECKSQELPEGIPHKFGTPGCIAHLLHQISKHHSIVEVGRAKEKNPLPDPGWYYGRRKNYQDPEPLYITGAHRVKTRSGFESFQAFEWFGPVVKCIVIEGDA